MKIDIYEQRILTPEEGHWLYNAEAGVVSDKVYLGKEADINAWTEITDEEKNRIEAIKEEF